jgi:hypothetical protein
MDVEEAGALCQRTDGARRRPPGRLAGCRSDLGARPPALGAAAAGAGAARSSLPQLLSALRRSRCGRTDPGPAPRRPLLPPARLPRLQLGPAYQDGAPVRGRQRAAGGAAGAAGGRAALAARGRPLPGLPAQPGAQHLVRAQGQPALCLPARRERLAATAARTPPSPGPATAAGGVLGARAAWPGRASQPATRPTRPTPPHPARPRRNHIGFTYDSSTRQARVYVNGLLLREQALEPPRPMKAYNFALGPMSVTKNMGTIRLANVRVWKRALPLGELQHSMAVRDFATLPQVGRWAGLLGRWAGAGLGCRRALASVAWGGASRAAGPAAGLGAGRGAPACVLVPRLVAGPGDCRGRRAHPTTRLPFCPRRG